MSDLGANLAQLNDAGQNLLPEAAKVYTQMVGDVNAADPPVDAGMWSGVQSTAVTILNAAKSNLENAGDVLRLIAYDIAATDSAAAAELKEKANFDEIPTLTKSGWSDE